MTAGGIASRCGRCGTDSERLCEDGRVIECAACAESCPACQGAPTVNVGPDPKPVCPECKAGKHRNCDTTAWDFETDEPTACRCDEYTKHLEAVRP